jgi:hypothetical protein
MESFGLRITTNKNEPTSARIQPVPKADGTLPTSASVTAIILSSMEIPKESILLNE